MPESSMLFLNTRIGGWGLIGKLGFVVHVPGCVPGHLGSLLGSAIDLLCHLGQIT